MARKTYQLDKDGIWITGQPTKAAAKRAWLEARDAFVAIAGENPPWVFHYAKHVLIVAPLPMGAWMYTIVAPESREESLHATCTYSAASRQQARGVGVGALAQRLWSRDILDDAAWFDAITRAASLSPADVLDERRNLLTVTAHWRAHPVAA